MQLLTLGGLRFADSDFTRPKPLLLLCYLAIEGSQSRRVLAELFFGDTKDPRDSLSSTLRHLRPFEEALAADGDRVSTRVRCDALDLIEALDTGVLEPGVEMYRGAFLDGLDLDLGEELEEWMFLTREYLASRVREAHVRLGEVAAARGDTARGVQHAEAGLDLPEAPPIEPDLLPRIYALLAAGNSPLARRVRAWAEEVGVSLEPASVDTVDAAAVGVFVGGEPSPKPPHNLPAPTTSFVGRDSERLEIAGLLAQPHCRLVTVHGPGGMGKSRLAMRAARDQVVEGSFQDGVYLVPLEALAVAEQIPEAIGSALGVDVTGHSNAEDALTSALRDRRLLLILDGLEHLMEGAPIVSRLIGACPRLNILVTSRARLDLAEEHVLTLQGLPAPALTETFDEAVYADALQLFVARAKKTQIDFRLGPQALPEAVRICELLDGSPLGIELATTWIRAMPLRAIREEIEASLEFLETPARNASPRHRSLRAVFERSWQLLDAASRKALPKLAAFRGGFRREAAGRIADVKLPMLMKLVDASLVHVRPDGRYGLHALVYEFCRERLASHAHLHASVLDLHTAYFREYAHGLLGKMYTEEEPEALALLETDLPNILDAWRRILDGGLEPAEAFPTELVVFFDRLGRFQEGIRFFEAAAERLDAVETGEPLLAEILASLAWLYYRSGELDRAEGLARRAARMDSRPGRGTMMACNIVGLVLHQLERAEEATAYFQRAIRTALDLGAHNRAAMYRINLASSRMSLGQRESAKQDLQAVIGLAKERNYPFLQATAQNNLASMVDEDGDSDAARRLFEQTLDLVEASGYVRMRPLLLANLAEAYMDAGLYGNAEVFLARAEQSLPADTQEAIPGLILDVKGRLQLAAGDVDAAEATLCTALEFALGHLHDSRHLKILVHLAEVQQARGRHAEALAIVRAVRPRAKHLGTLTRSMDAIVDALPEATREANGVDASDTRVAGMRLAEIFPDGTI